MNPEIGLFDRIFKYRQSEYRSPTEDFITEILAEFIRYAPSPIAMKIVRELFVPIPWRAVFDQESRQGPMDVVTQKWLPGGKYLDLVIGFGGKPFLAVESKINAAFQWHRKPANADSNSNAALVYQHQLITYGDWLRDDRKACGRNFPGVITLLTHVSPPPDDFTSDNAGIYGAVPHVCYWRQVHARLKQCLSSPSCDDLPAWVFLAKQLCTFLENQNMASVDLDGRDVAALSLAMEALGQLPAMFAETAKDLCAAHGELTEKYAKSKVDGAEGLCWGWNYFEDGKDTYLGYGLYFPSVRGSFANAQPPFPEYYQAFIVVGRDNVKLSEGVSAIPEGWCDVSGWMLVKPLALSDRVNDERLPEYFRRQIKDQWQNILTMQKRFLDAKP